jgi:endonuclease YncB( thermonuclease family)
MAQREFPAVLSKVRDGDTVYVWCDMGYDTWRYTKLRIMASPKMGIACRELSKPGGKEAKDYMIGLLPPRTYPDEGTTFIVYSYDWDKFAPRIDGDILLYNGRLTSELMIESGYATAWDGKGKQPLPAWPLPPVAGEQGSLFLP